MNPSARPSFFEMLRKAGAILERARDRTGQALINFGQKKAKATRKRRALRKDKKRRNRVKRSQAKVRSNRKKRKTKRQAKGK